ncbi:hypothetical protein FEM48_Zijuj04G0052200 [Ziziphus jujuba var. spinosa]|uniref:Uncharacterized protein n=1 Tax=Ziziphus jujuba var. spinosa TaxID=714518 RepID=A0A978VI01_ZIZJJ|nr:uncharacterized protein LOC107408050 isoform X2 [Ziziphus jujuba var. spinosa]KAH7532720.1 hypothetical protein FEM48_Zijuj04G0052200 [Ziziphus jujuba var. spinosa]
MPGNEIEDRIRILYEIDNFSLDQHQSQAVDDRRPVLIYNQWIEKQRLNNEPLNFNWKNYSLQQLDSPKGHGNEALSAFDQNYAQLIPRPELFDSQTGNQELINTNGFMLGQQNFQAGQNQPELLGETGFLPHNLISRGLPFLNSQQENASADSPTLTTNSERSEITEASTEFNFVGGQQQLLRGQQPGIPQLDSMQQSGFNDIQLLQQHIMFRQLQEFQRQQQLQQFGDARQQSSLNQHSSISKQASGVQYSPLINGTPVSDTSQMFMNLMQRGASPAVQGISNRMSLSQEQGQTLHSIGMVPQQLDVSLYGTPIASARAMGQYPHLQGMSHDSASLLSKASSEAQKPMVQSSAFSNPFIGEQYAISPDQICLPQGAFLSKHGFQGKNMHGQVPLQGLNSDAILGNPHPGQTIQTNASMQELNEKQERGSWLGVLEQKTHLGPSQGLVPLDPMEEKILYNTDDDIWDASFGRHTDMGAGGSMEHAEYSNAIPSIQSGTWSALMQSAVAEASSSDTGVQEEWSGLTFQNTEMSTDNQTSNILDSDKQQGVWTDNNLQRVSSLGSKPFSMLNDSNTSSSFPGFHQPGIQFVTKQRDELLQDSHESIQKSPKNTSEWLDYNPQQKLPTGSQQVQQLMHLDNAWAGQINEHSESNVNQQRISSGVVSQPGRRPEGYSNEANYIRKDSGGFPWKSDVDRGPTSISRSTGGLGQVQSIAENSLLYREGSQTLNFGAAANAHMPKAHQEMSQQVSGGNQLDYMKQVKISMNNNEENENLTTKQLQMSNSTLVMPNSYERAVYEQQHNSYERDNTYDNYNSNGMSAQEQEHLGQFKFTGDVSNNAISLDKGNLPNFQGDSRAPEEASRGDLNISSTFHRSVGFAGSNSNPQTSQNMLELLHKVDQSKENAATPHFGSTSISPLYEAAEAGTIGASFGQMHNQSSGSQGFALKLAPPSQRLVNSNMLLSSHGLPQTASNLNSRHRHSNLGEKNQTQLAPPSAFQSMASSTELSPRGHWDDKFSTSQHRNMPSSLYGHQSSTGAITSNPQFSRNQLQTQLMSNAPVSCASSQTLLPGTSSRYSPFNLAPSQDTSQQIGTNSSNQQFPVLEAVPASQPPTVSGAPQQGWFSVRSQSLWTNTLAQQHPSGMQPHKISSMDPSIKNMETTSLTPQDQDDQDSQKVGHKSSELIACSISSQGTDHGEELPETEGAKNIPDVDDYASGSFLAHSHQQDLNRLHPSDNNTRAGSERVPDSLGHPLKPSQGLQQNYSLLHQVQTMKNVENDQSTRVLNVQQVNAMAGQHKQNSMLRNLKDDGLNSASHLNSIPSGNTKMLSFFTEAREDPRLKASPQPSLQDIPSQGTVPFRQKDFQSQPGGSNVVSDNTENSRANVKMAPTWFKQFENFRNGLMPPIYEARFARTAAAQFSLMKPSQSLGIHSSVEQLNVADAGQSNRVLPSTSANFIASEPFSATDVLPSDVINQRMTIVRPKKRKTFMSERLPWHKEVTQGSGRIQDISMAERDWAQASNRVTEKMEDEFARIEDGQPLLRSKRRLILTTQLMQLLLCPAPASFLSANATLHYDSVAYFVAKLSLGDACSLTCCSRNESCVPVKNSNVISEKVKVSESIDDQCYSKCVEDFTNRSEKLESNLLRLDKATSILDIRVECQELEKVSVINRFAKFHVRQADTSGTTSSSGTPTISPKAYPQRYVTAQPMPVNVPEGVQCLSL